MKVMNIENLLKSMKLATAAGALLLVGAGCREQPRAAAPGASSAGSTALDSDGHAAHAPAAHAHAGEGPHHGTLVELGDEEFHAELVHDGDVVTVYVLDGSAENTVSIDAKELTINVMREGVPAQFQLQASRDEADSDDKSSRFIIENAELAHLLDDGSASPKLSVTIDGTPYRGEIQHQHDHSGHDHEH